MLTKVRVQEFLKEIEVDDLVKNLQIVGMMMYIDMVAHLTSKCTKKEARGSYETSLRFGVWRTY